MKENDKILLLAVLGTAAAWLWFTRSGQAIAQAAGGAIGKGAFNIMQTRGERNNNPGNIRISSTAWQGKIPLGENTDGAFEQFHDAVFGIRALAKNLRTYFDSYGLNTVQKIIARWAPGHENPTDNYIASVAREIGVSPTAPINLSDPGTLFALTKGIIRFENGRVSFTDAQINEGIQRALT